MRSANSHIDLAIIRARHGDLDQAVHHGLTAFGYDRKTEASLLSRAADLPELPAAMFSVPGKDWHPATSSRDDC